MRYFTKEWFLNCQTFPMTESMRKKADEAGDAYRFACEKEKLPDNLLKNFSFHDGVIREITSGTDYILSIDSPFSEYHTVIFRSALLKQEQPIIGAEWLYEELYRHKSGIGYEAHILFFSPSGAPHKKIRESDLIDLKIICEDIVIQ